MNEYISERVLSDESGLSVKTLQKWRGLRIGPPWVKFGRSVRYRRADVEAWLRSRTVTPSK